MNIVYFIFLSTPDTRWCHYTAHFYPKVEVYLHQFSGVHYDLLLSIRDVKLQQGVCAIQRHISTCARTHTNALKNERWDRIDGNSRNSTIRIITSTSCMTHTLTPALTPSSFLCVSCSLRSPSTSPPPMFSFGMVTHNTLTAWIPGWTAAGMKERYGHHTH